MIRIPWWSKIFIKILLSRLHISYSFWQKVHLFRHGAMDNIYYALKVFHFHIGATNLFSSTKGKTILELGPGDSIATSIICYAYGARSILVDTNEYASSDLNFYQVLINELKKYKGTNVPDISKTKSLSDILSICNSKYISNGLFGLKLMESNSVDLIFSQSVLQHIFKYEFIETMSQTFRILKQNGKCSHEIVFHDHIGGSLNSLRFSEKIWESNLFKTSGFYTNRIHFKKMIKIFEDVGFNYQIKEITKWKKIPIKQKNLSLEFQGLYKNDLDVLKLNVILYK